MGRKRKKSRTAVANNDNDSTTVAIEDLEPAQKKIRLTTEDEYNGAVALPADCLFQIYLFCEPVHVFSNLRFVCKNWNEVFSVTNRFWRRMYGNFFSIYDKRDDDDDEETWERRFKMRYESCLFLDENWAIARLGRKIAQKADDIEDLSIKKWNKLRKWAKRVDLLTHKRDAWLEFINNLTTVTTRLSSSSLDWFQEHNNCLFVQSFPEEFAEPPTFEEDYKNDLKLSIVLYGNTMTEITIQLKFNILSRYFELSYTVRDHDEESDPVIFLYYYNNERREMEVDKKSIMDLTRELLGSQYDIPTQFLTIEGDPEDDDDDVVSIPVPKYLTMHRIIMSLFEIGKESDPTYDVTDTKPLTMHLHVLWKEVMNDLNAIQTQDITNRDDDQHIRLEERDDEDEDDELDADDVHFIADETEVEHVRSDSEEEEEEETMGTFSPTHGSDDEESSHVNGSPLQVDDENDELETSDLDEKRELVRIDDEDGDLIADDVESSDDERMVYRRRDDESDDEEDQVEYRGESRYNDDGDDDNDHVDDSVNFEEDFDQE